MKPSNFLKTSNNYLDYLRTEGYSASTIRFHERCLSLLKKWAEQEQLQIHELSYNDLLAYIRYKQNNGTGNTGLSRYLTAIKTYFTYLTEQGSITSNPAVRIRLRGLQRKKLHYIFTPLQLQQLYNNYISTLDESPESLRNKVITGLVIYQGVRAEELYKLGYKDVKLREGEIEIPGGKRSEARTLQLEACQMMDMHRYITEARKEILQTVKRESEKLFVSTGKEGKLYNLLYSLMQKLKKTEPQFKSLEQIRASVISKWLKKYNLRQVQYMAGHRYVSSTEAYRQTEMEGLTDEVNRFHPLG